MIAKAQIATTPIGRAGGNRRGQRAQGGGWVAGGDGDDAGMGGMGMGGRRGWGWGVGSPGAPAVRCASGPGASGPVMGLIGWKYVQECGEILNIPLAFWC